MYVCFPLEKKVLCNGKDLFGALQLGTQVMGIS